MKNKIWALLVLMLGLLVTGCSSAFQPAATPTPTQNPEAPGFTIQLTEFAFTPDRIKLRVGQNVTFHVINAGATEHELMIGRNPLRNENGELGDGFEHDFFALTTPKVTGDAQVMGMESGGMNMGTATPEAGMTTGTEIPGSGMAMETGTPGAQMGGMEMENGFMVMFEPKQEATITFTVTKDMLGTWTMGCFETSAGKVHFDQGMVGNVIVLSQ